jgi:hypothetical protein
MFLYASFYEHLTFTSKILEHKDKENKVRQVKQELIISR